MDCIEAPNLYTVRTYDSWVSERSLKRALESASPTRRAQAVRAEDRRGLPGRLPDAYRAELMEAARRHLPLGRSVSRSALRKHLVPIEDQASSQSCYVLWDGRSARTELYNVPAGVAEASCCRTESMDYAAPGMWGICETLDAELIEVFLAEGYGAEADVSAAVDARDEELLDVFWRYGVSLSPKRVIDVAAGLRTMFPMAWSPSPSGRLAQVALQWLTGARMFPSGFAPAASMSMSRSPSLLAS